jgi:hypothetical protein
VLAAATDGKHGNVNKHSHSAEAKRQRLLTTVCNYCWACACAIFSKENKILASILFLLRNLLFLFWSVFAAATVCKLHSVSHNYTKQKCKKLNMNELARIGKRKTILISISILLVSIHTIYFYHSVRPEIETKKLIQQLIRFLLTIGLLIMVYKGKNWAKIVSIILFSLAIVFALFGLANLDIPFINKVPLLVMVFVYSISIYHFGIDKSFKEFFSYQNTTRNS